MDSFTEAESRRFDEPKFFTCLYMGSQREESRFLERECGGYGENLNLNNHVQVTGMACTTLTRLMRLRRCP